LVSFKLRQRAEKAPAASTPELRRVAFENQPKISNFVASPEI